MALNKMERTNDIQCEIIVVDDGSSDDTEDYVKAVITAYHYKYIYLERCNISSRSRTRNKGIEHASGDILVFIDGDIIVPKNYLMQLNRYYEKNSNLIVIGERILLNQEINEGDIENVIDFNKDFLKQIKTGKDFRKAIWDDVSYNCLALKAPFLYACSCNMAVPSKIINEVNGFDEEMIKWGIEDVDCAYRMYQKGARIVINPNGTVIHQFHGIIQSNKVTVKQIEDVKYNTRIFLRKNRNFLGLTDKQVYTLFESIADNYRKIEAYEDSMKEELDIRNMQQAEYAKRQILKLTGEKNLIIVVKDYFRNSGLDIWIQLNKKPMHNVRYYPYYDCV